MKELVIIGELELEDDAEDVSSAIMGLEMMVYVPPTSDKPVSVILVRNSCFKFIYTINYNHFYKTLGKCTCSIAKITSRYCPMTRELSIPKCYQRLIKPKKWVL
ncbi:hypothetical protein Hanom_Chr17g01539831 [Helianthus anomalus]